MISYNEIAEISEILDKVDKDSLALIEMLNRLSVSAQSVMNAVMTEGLTAQKQYDDIHELVERCQNRLRQQ